MGNLTDQIKARGSYIHFKDENLGFEKNCGGHCCCRGRRGDGGGGGGGGGGDVVSALGVRKKEDFVLRDIRGGGKAKPAFSYRVLNFWLCSSVLGPFVYFIVY